MNQNQISLKAILTGNLEPGFIKIFLGINWIILAVVTAITLLFFPQKVASGVLLGGIIANLNCIGLNKDCIRIMRWRSMAAYYAGMAVRMGLIALAITVAMLYYNQYFSPVGLFVGLSVAVVNFYLLVIAMLVYRVKYKEAI